MAVGACFMFGISFINHPFKTFHVKWENPFKNWRPFRSHVFIISIVEKGSCKYPVIILIKQWRVLLALIVTLKHFHTEVGLRTSTQAHSKISSLLEANERSWKHIHFFPSYSACRIRTPISEMPFSTISSITNTKERTVLFQYKSFLDKWINNAHVILEGLRFP